MASKASKKRTKPPAQSQPAEVASSTSVAAKSAPAHGLNIWLRLVIVAGLCLIGWTALQSQINRMNAELIAQRGQKIYQMPGQLERAKGMIDSGLRRDPGHVEIRYWYANTLLRSQHRRAVGSGHRNLDKRDLDKALELFDSIRGTHYIPFGVASKTAETAHLLANQATVLGATEDFYNYGETAVENYLRYRRLVSRPMQQPTGFYTAAASIAASTDNMDYALLFNDDFLHYYGFFYEGPWNGETNRQDRNIRLLTIANEARWFMGEHHVMLAEIGSTLYQEPGHELAIKSLLRAVVESGRVKEAEIILEQLERANRLSPKTAVILDAIRDRTRSVPMPEVQQQEIDYLEINESVDDL